MIIATTKNIYKHQAIAKKLIYDTEQIFKDK